MRNFSKTRRFSNVNCVLGVVAASLFFVTIGLYMLNLSNEAEHNLKASRRAGGSPSSVLQNMLHNESTDDKAASPISASVLQQRLSGLLKSNDFDWLKQQLRTIRTGDIGRVYSMKPGEKPVAGGAGLSGPMKESPLIEEADELIAESALVGAPWTRLKFHRSVDRSRTILVAIANANSNTQCSALVDSIFTNAKYPFQIRVGLVESMEDVKLIAKRQSTPTHPGSAPLEMHIKSDVAALDDEFNRHLDSNGGATEEEKQAFKKANLPSNIDIVDRDLIYHRSSCVHPKHALCNQRRFCPTDFVRVRKVPRSEMLEKGRGMSWMKHLSTMMYRSEQYILMLDAASGLMAKDWDATLVEQYLAAQVAAGTPTAKGLVALSGRLPTATTNHHTAAAFSVPSGGAAALTSCSLPYAVATVLSSKAVPTITSTSKGTEVAATTEFFFTEGAPFLNRVPLDPFALDAPAALSDLVLSARLSAAGYKVVVPNAEPAIVSPPSTNAVLEMDKALSLFTEAESADIAPLTAHRTTGSAYLQSIARLVSVLTYPTESGVFETSDAMGTISELRTPKDVLTPLVGAEGAGELIALAEKVKKVCSSTPNAGAVLPVKDVRYTIGGYYALRFRILNEHKRLAREDMKKSDAD
jgi:hypothetical protein